MAPVHPDRSRRCARSLRLVGQRVLLAVLAGGLGGLLLAGCGLPSFGMPGSTTKQGARTYTLWQVMFMTAIVVGAVVWGLIIWSVLRYRRRADSDVPNQRPYNIGVEVLYTVVPIVMVIAVFIATIGVQRANSKLTAHPDVTVEVHGFQWQWQFVYPDDHVTVTGDSVNGHPPKLVLPVGQKVRLRLVAEDVAHSFWVPRFLSKRDLIPGVRNEIEVDPTTSGHYVGRCAEFCGLDHWRMYFEVQVVSPAEYRRWLATEQGKSR